MNPPPPTLTFFQPYGSLRGGLPARACAAEASIHMDKTSGSSILAIVSRHSERYSAKNLQSRATLGDSRSFASTLRMTATGRWRRCNRCQNVAEIRGEDIEINAVDSAVVIEIAIGKSFPG